VLSIGKLAAGQAKYYLDQAEAQVDARDELADMLAARVGRGEPSENLDPGA